MILLHWVLSAMSFLVPNVEHYDLGNAISTTVHEKGCLFQGERCEQRTAALLTAVAFRESRFEMSALGKAGDSCAFQLVAAPKAVRKDVKLCTSIAYDRLAASLKACGGIQAYATGRCSLGNRIDADRKWLAGDLVKRIPWGVL
jgi:hypothetical protein